MALATHCLPNGSLGIAQIPVPNVSSANVSAVIPSGGLGNGNIRGVIVVMHGLSVAIQAVPVGLPTSNSTTPDFTSYTYSFMNNVVADGWIVLFVNYPEDFYSGIGATGIWNDLNNDSGHGSRYLTTQLLWWDHVVDYIHLTYGPTIPIVAMGISWGGYHTLQIAANRQSSIIAYAPVVPATLLSYVNYVFTSPANYGPNSQTVNGVTLQPLSGGTAGLDISQTHLNGGNASGVNVTIPGLVTYGTNDEAAGWHTTASSPGNTPINSNTDSMLTNAFNAGLSVSRNQTAAFHEFTADMAGFTTSFTGTGGTALSSLGTLTVGSNTSLVSGHCAIWASDKAWHVISFTGTSGTTQLTGCTYSGTTSATVASGASICLTGTPITGGYNSIAIPYWLNTTVNAPKQF